MPSRQTGASRDDDLATLVLSASKKDWLKVAMIIGLVNRECEARDMAASYEAIADCIERLCKAGKLESVGIVSDWRHSEVRLPAGRVLD